MRALVKMFFVIIALQFCTKSMKNDASLLYIEDIFLPSNACALTAVDSIHIDYSAKDILLSERTIFKIDEYTNTIFTIDRQSGRVVSIDKNGDVYFIGEKGKGPTEYSGVSNLIVSDNYLYIHDAVNSRIVSYNVNTKELQTFPLKYRYNDISSIANNHFVGYSHMNNSLIHVFNSKFEVVDTVYENSLGGRMNIFLARFQDGNALSWKEKSIIYMYPDVYGFTFFDLDTREQISYAIREDNDFRSIIHPIPSGLDPYDYGERHRVFFESIPRPTILSVYQDNTILQWMYRISGPNEWSFFINSYSIESKVMCEGIKYEYAQLPFHVGDFIYTAKGSDSLNSITVYKNTIF